MFRYTCLILSSFCIVFMHTLCMPFQCSIPTLSSYTSRMVNRALIAGSIGSVAASACQRTKRSRYTVRIVGEANDQYELEIYENYIGKKSTFVQTFSITNKALQKLNQSINEFCCDLEKMSNDSSDSIRVLVLKKLMPILSVFEIQHIFIQSAGFDDLDAFKFLLQHVEKNDQILDQALALAMIKKNLETIKILDPLVHRAHESLLVAVMQGDVELTQKMLTNNSGNCNQALMVAVAFGHVDIIKILLPLATNYNDALSQSVKNLQYNKALTVEQHKEMIDLLFPHVTDCLPALKEAVSLRGNLECVHHVLSKMPVVDQKAIDIMMATISADSDAHKQKCRSLIETYLPQCSPGIIAMFLKKFPEDRNLFSEQQLREINFFNEFKKDDLIQKLFNPQMDYAQTSNTTITAQLFAKHKKHFLLEKFCRDVGLDYLEFMGIAEDLELVVAKIVDIESADKAKNFTTFFHGRSWEWNYVNDVWNIIRALQDNLDHCSDSISMRQRDGSCDVARLYQDRKKLVEHGVLGQYLVSATHDTRLNDSMPESSEVTFMTYSGLSHLDCLPECSMRYFFDNHSATGGMSGYYRSQILLDSYKLSKYQADFDLLRKMHEQSSKYGELVVISVANESLNDIVYPARIGGYRMGDLKATDVIKTIKHDVATIEQKVMQNGSPIFCAAALSIPGEDESLYTIQSINLADPEKYQKYLQERDKLFEKIKRDRCIAQ